MGTPTVGKGLRRSITAHFFFLAKEVDTWFTAINVGISGE
jgi:hypothetical protein